MRHICKGNIPLSLISTETNNKRQAIIEGGKYIDTKPYNDCFRAADVREELETIYNRKCAYCEQEQEMMDIEHYRSKFDYYWFAFSWDNLLLSCRTCNSAKNVKFPIVNRQHTEIPPFDRIHNSGKDFDSIENPQIINPETDENPEIHFKFDKDGVCYGVDNMGITTVNVCKLNRRKLNEKRQKIFDKLKTELEEHEALFGLAGRNFVVNKFIKTIQNPQKYEFIAFRIHILKNELKFLY